MNADNQEARIAALENSFETLARLGKREVEERTAMCMTVMQWTVEIKTDHLELVKSLADTPSLWDAGGHQKLLDHIARVESVLERMEKIIADGRQIGGDLSGEPPSTES